MMRARRSCSGVRRDAERDNATAHKMRTNCAYGAHSPGGV
jgi:hypothetical protein